MLYVYFPQPNPYSYASYKFLHFAATTTTTSTTTTTTTTTKPPEASDLTATVGLSVGIVLFVLLAAAVALGVFFWRRKNANSQKITEKPQTVTMDEPGPKKNEPQTEGRKEESWTST